MEEANMMSETMLGTPKDDVDICKNSMMHHNEWTHPIDMKENRQGKLTWWDGGGSGSGFRDWTGSVVNIFYICMLLAEIITWVKVLMIWRSDSETPGYAIAILLSLLLPTIVIPLLSILHSLVIGRLSYSSALLLIIPPSPIVLHLMVLYRKIAREDHSKLSLATRVACLVQSLLMSFPLLLFSLMTLVRAVVDIDKVVIDQIHHHLFQHNIQPLASCLSLINLLVSIVRYNERESGRAVTILAGFPFIFSSIGFRLIGFCLLFTYFEPMWVLLCLGLLFCISATGVQLSSGHSPCSQKMGQRRHQESREGPGTVVCLLLSIANIIVPTGYNSDKYLGHCRRGTWKLILVTWIGTTLIFSLVINHCLINHIPNTYTGLAPVDMNMIMPKTGLAVNLPNIAMGGVDFKLTLPKTQMTMVGDFPASFEFVTSSDQDIILALVFPILLVLVTVPFVMLRILVLGWDCRMVRQKEEEIQSAGKIRNCLTVCCGVSAMMMFTLLMAIVVMTNVLIIIQTTSNPLSREINQS